jgi:hypothetical protein
MTLLHCLRVASAAALAAVLIGGCSASGSADRDRSARQEREGDDEAEECSEEAEELPLRDVAPHAKVSIHQVLASAAASRVGTVLEAGLEGERAAAGTDVFFEVVLLDGSGGVWQLKVDPATAVVTSNSAESDADEVREMKALASKLGADHLTLDELAARAESSVPGSRALVAGFQLLDRGVLACVKLVGTEGISNVTLDPQTGKVVASSKADRDEDEDEGEDEGEGEEDGDHNEDEASGR